MFPLKQVVKLQSILTDQEMTSNLLLNRQVCRYLGEKKVKNHTELVSAIHPFFSPLKNLVVPNCVLFCFHSHKINQIVKLFVSKYSQQIMRKSTLSFLLLKEMTILVFLPIGSF